MIINVNTDAVVKFTNKLEKMRKSDFPVAVRGTLNGAAFDMKKDTLLESAKTTFKKRHNGNFYKKFSTVEKATGFDVKTMSSTTGFTEQGLELGSRNYAIKDLEDQEKGGSIDKRSFLALKGARGGRSKSPVKAKFRMSELPKERAIVSAEEINTIAIKGNSRRITSKRQKYIVAAIVAKRKYGNDAFILGNEKNGRKTLSKINEVFEGTRSGSRSIKIDRTPLYSVKKGFAARVKATNFAQRAAFETQSKMEEMFIKEAQRRFEKALK